MPVMILYETKPFPSAMLNEIAQSIASLTKEQLDAKIELRVVQTVFAYNANEIHLEMRFRDFGDWTNEQLTDYHVAVMSKLGNILSRHKITGSYSFYIIPSTPPRSIWDQGKVL